MMEERSMTDTDHARAIARGHDCRFETCPGETMTDDRVQVDKPEES